MSKIVLTQKQIEEIAEKIAQEKTELNEDNSGYSRYSMRCNVITQYYSDKVKFKGQEINDINAPEMRLTYDIDIEGRSWGIKSISLYGIQGPSEVELDVDYYLNDGTDDGNTETETITIPLDWENVEIEEEEGQGIISIGRDVTLELGNDNEGNIVCTHINVSVYTL